MRRTAVPLLLLSLLIGAVLVMQYHWLTELATAARDRMERDLRVAVQATAGTVDLELTRLGAAIAAAEPDPVALDSARVAWARAAPDLAGLFAEAGALPPIQLRRGQETISLGIDSTWIADSLLPALARRIAATAELEVALALAYSSGAGSDRVVARTGSPGRGTPDAAAPIFTTGGTRRLFFIRADGVKTGGTPPVATWSAQQDDSADVRPAAAVGWELRAWHAAGSLERAAARLRRRNLAVGFGLMALLAASGGYTIASYHRSRRLAEDRASVLAGISHEARTPLAVIRSAADNLAGGVVLAPGDVAEYGRIIEAQTERLTGVVEGALAFARVADPGVRTRERVDLRQIMHEAVSDAGSPSRVSSPDGPPAWCGGDAHALAMAVRNLIANALAYSPTGTTVEVAFTNQSGGIEISVSDRGPGIAPGELARVFEPFQRGVAGSASGRGGLGLGLTLAHRVARLHGGELVYAAREGGGARFTLRLPQTS